MPIVNFTFSLLRYIIMPIVNFTFSLLRYIMMPIVNFMFSRFYTAVEPKITWLSLTAEGSGKIFGTGRRFALM
jgi:hypothetical protein